MVNVVRGFYMRRIVPIVATFTALVLVYLFAAFGITQAQTIRTGADLTVRGSEIIDGSYIAAGQTIDISGTVNGDVICGAQTVTISGTVRGDIICAAQSIVISGQVDGDIRLAAQTVTHSGTVEHNASIIGQNVHLAGDSTIKGDLSFAGATLTSAGTIGRDIASGAQNITISGSVGRNLDVGVQKLVLNDGASVTGNIKYTSENQADIASGATIGSIEQLKPTANDQRDNKPFISFVLWYVITALFCSLIIILLIPLFFWNVSREALESPGWTILLGFLTSLALPALTVLSFVTIIGIPLGILLLFIGIVLVLLSFPVAAFYLGRLLFNNWFQLSDNAIILMLLGTVALIVLLAIPFLNFFVWLLMIWIGFGSMVRSFKHHVVRPVYTMPVVPVTRKGKARTVR